VNNKRSLKMIDYGIDISDKHRDFDVITVIIDSTVYSIVDYKKKDIEVIIEVLMKKVIAMELNNMTYFIEGLRKFYYIEFDVDRFLKLLEDIKKEVDICNSKK